MRSGAMGGWRGRVGAVVVMGLVGGLLAWVGLEQLRLAAESGADIKAIGPEEARDVCLAPEVICYRGGQGGGWIRLASFAAERVNGIQGDVRLELSCGTYRSGVVWDVSLRLPVGAVEPVHVVMWDWFGVSERLAAGSGWAVDGATLRAPEAGAFVEDVLAPVSWLGGIMYGSLRMPAFLELRVDGTVESWFFAGFDLRRVRGVVEGLRRACRVGRVL